MNVNILDYGANGDGKALNTEAFAAAVQACARSGGGYVEVPAGAYLTGTVRLASNVFLRLAPGARVLGSPLLRDYEGPERGCAWDQRLGRITGNPELNLCRALILAEDAQDCGIVGPGTIDGCRGGVPAPEAGRPMLVVFSRCRNVTLRDLTLTRPGMFCSYMLACRDVTIRGVRIESATTPCGDGLDFDGGENVTISDCLIDAGDDGISLKSLTPGEPCLRFTISNCVIRARYWGAIRIGPESTAGARHIAVSNCVFRDCNDGLKIQLTEDAEFADFTFSNITMDRVVRPLFVTNTRYRFSSLSHGVRPPAGAMRRFSFCNINATLFRWEGEGWALPNCYLYALPGSVMEDLTLSNLQLCCPGGGTAADADRADHPEMLDFVEQYPESCLRMGSYPSAGLYIRNAQRICLDGVTVQCAEPDARCAVAAEAVDGLYLHRVRARNCGGVLRHIACPGLQLLNCEGEVRPLSAAQAAQWQAARSLAEGIDRRMAEIAALMDALAERMPLEPLPAGGAALIFTAEEGTRYALVLPLVRGDFRVLVNGDEVARHRVPPAYATLTSFACELHDRAKPGLNRVELVTPEDGLPLELPEAGAIYAL